MSTLRLALCSFLKRFPIVKPVCPGIQPLRNCTYLHCTHASLIQNYVLFYHHHRHYSCHRIHYIIRCARRHWLQTRLRRLNCITFDTCFVVLKAIHCNDDSHQSIQATRRQTSFPHSINFVTVASFPMLMLYHLVSYYTCSHVLEDTFTALQWSLYKTTVTL